MEKSQAIAYATIAMKKLGYKEIDIEHVTNLMLEEFEETSREQAEDRADEIIYKDH